MGDLLEVLLELIFQDLGVLAALLAELINVLD